MDGLEGVDGVLGVVGVFGAQAQLHLPNHLALAQKLARMRVGVGSSSSLF